MIRTQLLWMLAAACLVARPVLADTVSRLVSNLKAGHQQTVVAYGTSLTAGGAWVKQVQSALDLRYPGLATFVNSGGSGQWSKWGVENLDALVISKKPDALFVEFGVNDAVERFHGSVEIARSNLESMVTRVLAAQPQCEIVLMTTTPADAYPKGHGSHREGIEAYYQMYRDVARQRGLLLVDHYRNWLALRASDPEAFKRYVPDSVHPSVEGCTHVVTPAILKVLGIEPSPPGAPARY